MKKMMFIVLIILIFSFIVLLSACRNKDTEISIPLSMQYDDYYICVNAENVKSKDSSIIEVVSGNTLRAAGIGIAAVVVDGEEYTIKVEKASLSVFLCIGQSNMTVISTGSEELAIKPKWGTAYWNSLTDNTSLSVDGVKGLFGAFADEYYKNTGEKCLLIQGAAGGSSISSWQTQSDFLGNAISAYNKSVKTLDEYMDRYEVVRTGYLWLQGETDCRMGMSSLQYTRSFLKMHDMLNEKCEILQSGADKAFDFVGIFAVRSWSGLSGYMRPLNIVFTGPRTAQYALGNSDSMTVNDESYDTSNIYLITNITENWYSDESVKAWFSSDELYYEQDAGINKMIGDTETATDALMPPYISSASNTTYPDQHYLQKAYNEMGADAAYNLSNILNVKDKNNYSVVLRAYNGIDFYKDGDEVVITRKTAVLVPCVTNLSAPHHTFVIDFKSDSNPEARVNGFGEITGLGDNESGSFKVFLNNSDEPILTVKVTMSEQTVRPSIFGDEEAAVYLSDLIDSEECIYWKVNLADSGTANPQRIPGKDVNYDEHTLSVADITYKKGIGLHPQELDDSEIQFNISSYGCDKFYAVVGSPKLSGTGNGVICSVYADYGDGKYKMLEESKVLLGETVHAFDLDINGVMNIRLVVNNNGSHVSDSTTWAYSVIFKKK